MLLHISSSTKQRGVKMNDQQQNFKGWEMRIHENGAGCSVNFGDFCLVFEDNGESVIVADPLQHKGDDATHPYTATANAFFKQHYKEGRDIIDPETRARNLIEERERSHRSLKIIEDLIEESREEYAQAAAAVDALNLPPAELERLTAEAVKNVEDRNNDYEQHQQEIRRRELEALKSVSCLALNNKIRVLLIWADEPDHIAGLEAACGMTQAENIDDWLEASCWSDEPNLAPFVGHKGTTEERRAAFRYALALQGTYPK